MPQPAPVPRLSARQIRRKAPGCFTVRFPEPDREISGPPFPDARMGFLVHCGGSSYPFEVLVWHPRQSIDLAKWPADAHLGADGTWIAVREVAPK